MKPSHPTWVRGLKLRRARSLRKGRKVAPYVGAWIETIMVKDSVAIIHVAPYVGAWIETYLHNKAG